MVSAFTDRANGFPSELAGTDPQWIFSLQCNQPAFRAPHAANSDIGVKEGPGYSGQRVSVQWRRAKKWDETMIHRLENWKLKGKGKQPSGPGSSLASTAKVRPFLRDVFDKLAIQTFLDVPCGDMTWMPHVNLTGVDYMGGDISSSLVADNLASFAADPRFANKFAVFDITCMIPPKVDMIHTRDVFIHLDSDHSLKALQNFEKSGSKYIAIPHWPSSRGGSNVFHPNGSAYENYHTFNLHLPPFCLPAPLYSVQNGGGATGVVGVWKLPALGHGSRPECRNQG
ncbi:unnamed protein product [Symbiodinium pilosum]|uniref:Methyltransferase domain-containing protein n=1 Tax=Symbiodinium pilosum TaxID=2952 RepID=A0A812QT75_SYMPI|nr:unnamed protein product [Symbiodinium pilosum]